MARFNDLQPKLLRAAFAQLGGMSQPLRVFEPNVSVHVIHRGHNRQSIFGDDADCALFLSLLKTESAASKVAIHAFALMTNHYHLLVTPGGPQALPRAMRRANARYVRYFNDRYQRSGTLFRGRYRALLITDERYWLTCLRYVDLNPVRARMVRHPGDYRWSSYRAHACGDVYEWLAPHVVFDTLGASAIERAATYRLLCDTPLTESDLTLLRLHPAPAR